MAKGPAFPTPASLVPSMFAATAIAALTNGAIGWIISCFVGSDWSNVFTSFALQMAMFVPMFGIFMTMAWIALTALPPTVNRTLHQVVVYSYIPVMMGCIVGIVVLGPWHPMTLPLLFTAFAMVLGFFVAIVTPITPRNATTS